MSRADAKSTRTDILGAALLAAARIIYDERGIVEQVAHRLEQTRLFLIVPCSNYYYRLDDGPRGPRAGGPPGDSEFHCPAPDCAQRLTCAL
jgi:hypothetical protein